MILAFPICLHFDFEFMAHAFGALDWYCGYIQSEQINASQQVFLFHGLRKKNSEKKL